MEFNKSEKSVDIFDTRDYVPNGVVESVESVKLSNKPKELSANVRDEIKAWGPVLMALKDGLPLPNNPIINIRKIERYEQESGQDLSTLKNCCTAANELRDSKDTKKYFFAILERLVDIGNIDLKQ